MAKPFQFTFLLELAIDKRDDAAGRMRDARQMLENARQKQTEIENYRNEYRARLANNAGQGMAIYQWNDYRQFIARLDLAVEQMNGEITRCELVVENTRLAWLVCEKEVKAFETLQLRHNEREAHRENKREQSRSDEWVSNAYAVGAKGPNGNE